MKRYIARLVAEFAVEAENIVEARRVAKRIRAVGECVSIHRPSRHDAAGVVSTVERRSSRVDVRADTETGGEGE